MFSGQKRAFIFTCPDPSVFLDFYFFSLIQIKQNSSSINNKTPLAKNYFCRVLCLVQLFSNIWLFATPWAAACQASLSITNSQSLLKFMSIESVMPSNHLILCRPLLPTPSIFPSIRVFSNESALCMRHWALHEAWALCKKYWSFTFNISPSSEHQDWSPLGWTGWISL